ncbi:MAG: HAD-IA family hydrolase [Acidobacteriota bacterium]
MTSNRQFRLLVFDWDGTLMDSSATIAACMTESFRDLGVEAPSEEAIRSTIGLGLGEVLQRLAPSFSEDDRRRWRAAYRKHWFGTYRERPALFARAAETIAELAGLDYWLAVATGKGRPGLDRDLEVTGLSRYFLTSRTADDAPSKPHPQMLLDIMEELGVGGAETLMIGDTTFDLAMAQSAGAAAVGVLTGAHPRSQLMGCEPLECLQDVTELPGWLGRGTAESKP